MHEEIVDIALDYIRNNTSNIDGIFIGGYYYYSDDFDNYVFSKFEYHPININKHINFVDNLTSRWQQHCQNMMTKVIQGELQNADKDPVVDIRLDVNGIMLIKSVPKLPKSNFWPNGEKPRHDIRNPPLASQVLNVFPLLDEYLHNQYYKEDPANVFFIDNFQEYLHEMQRKQDEKCGDVENYLLPTSHDDFHGSYDSLGKYCVNKVNRNLIDLCERAKEGLPKIDGISFVKVDYHLIGESIENDIAIISYITGYNLPSERICVLSKPINTHFQQAIVYASAKAIKLGLDFIYYQKYKL